MSIRTVLVALRVPILALCAAVPLLAPTAAQAQWQRCAGQDQICRFEGQALVRYGADGRYAYRVVRNRVPCDEKEFGDPAYGVVKQCDYNRDLSQGEDRPTAPDGWRHCAGEGEYCRVNGTARVRYGAENRYEYRNVNGGVLCSARLFGDPAYGIHKTCEYLAYTGGNGDGNRPGNGNRPGSGNRPGNGGGPGNWEYCGSEGGYCSFSGPGEVRYGANGRFVTRRAINGMPCEVTAFGTDPAYGVNKSCFVNRGRR